MNRQKIALWLSISAICLVLCGVLLNCFSYRKEAFVNTVTLFNDFKMKKILEAEYKKVESMRKAQLDSMELVLKIIDKQQTLQNKREILGYKAEEYRLKQQEFEEANIALTDKYNEQIWVQLNQYVKDYGIKEGYDFIYGASGDGNLMYASDKNDITKEMLEYVNAKYDGLSN